MRKALKGFIAAGMLVAGMSGVSHAVNFASVNLSVSVTASIDISIVGTSTVSFNAVNLADATGVVGTNPVVLQNDSTGLNVTYSLAGNDDADWQLGGATTTVSTPALDQFALRAMFNTTAPSAAAFVDANTYLVSHTSPRRSPTQLAFPGGFRDSTATIFAGNQSGASVAPGAANQRSLWVKFIPASSSSVLWGARTLVVSVVAQLP